MYVGARRVQGRLLRRWQWIHRDSSPNYSQPVLKPPVPLPKTGMPCRSQRPEDTRKAARDFRSDPVAHGKGSRCSSSSGAAGSSVPPFFRQPRGSPETGFLGSPGAFLPQELARTRENIGGASETQKRCPWDWNIQHSPGEVGWVVWGTENL